MKKILFSLLILPLSFVSLPAASIWSSVAEKLQQSVVFVEVYGTEVTAQGGCSGFVINSAKKYVMTAAHCDGDKVSVDGTPTVKMFKDERKDLMVLRAYALAEKPALHLAKVVPERGEEIASMGFGYALEAPMFRIAHISNIDFEIESLSGPFVSIDATYIPGQSGGPVVNSAGDVVSIVQRGGDGLGLGVGAGVLKAKAGSYFEADSK